MSKPDTETSRSDPDDVPELTDERCAKATQMDGEKVVNRGGRPSGSDKTAVTMRVDSDVLERLRSDGPGWQTRANEALRKAVGL